MAKNFTEKQREILARRLGYQGPMEMFDEFVRSDPAMERKYNTVVQKLMAKGGVVKKYQTGGSVETLTLGGSSTPTSLTLSPTLQPVSGPVHTVQAPPTNAPANYNNYSYGTNNVPTAPTVTAATVPTATNQTVDSAAAAALCCC
jgi:hypothetical protein